MPTYTGSAPNQTWTVINPGTFTLNGLGGINTLNLGTSLRSSYIITQPGDGSTHVDSISGASAALHATLNNIERLTFNGGIDKWAIDIDGNAGTTAKILGAVFGAATIQARPDYVGIGLGYLDKGMGYADLMQLALNAAGATTSKAVVNLLWTNLFGAAPTTSQAAPYVAMIDSGSYNAGTLGVMAADTSINAANINLVGLHQMGLHYF